MGANFPRPDLVGAAEVVFTSPVFSVYGWQCIEKFKK